MTEKAAAIDLLYKLPENENEIPLRYSNLKIAYLF